MNTDLRAPTNLIPALQVLRRRLRWRDGVVMLTRWAWVAALAACAVQAIAWLVPFEHAAVVSAGVLLAALVGWLGWVILRPLPLAAVAWQVDAEARLKERLITALELLQVSNAKPSRLGQRQLSDAANAARRAAQTAAQTLPISWSRRPLAASLVLLLLTLALAVLPNPQRAVIAERRAVRELAQQEARRVERVRRDLAAREGLSPEARERLLAELDELAARLRENPGDRARALADIERARAALRARLDPQAGARRAALEQLSARLAQLSGRRPQRNTPGQGAAALQELARQVARMTPQAREETARALRDLASRIAASDPELAQALNDLATAAAWGNQAPAVEAAARGAQALAAAEEALNAQEALAQALSALERSRAALARGELASARQPGTGGGQGTGQGRDGGHGQRPGAGQGMGQAMGQGQGFGRGQPGGGGGTRADRLPPATRRGRFGGADPSRLGPGAQVGAYEPRVFAPLPPLETPRDVERIRGQPGEGGQVVQREREDTGPALSGEPLVPLADVLPAYREAAARALEQEYIPAGFKEYVRDYFSLIGEGGGN